MYICIYTYIYIYTHILVCCQAAFFVPSGWVGASGDFASRAGRGVVVVVVIVVVVVVVAAVVVVVHLL